MNTPTPQDLEKLVGTRSPLCEWWMHAPEDPTTVIESCDTVGSWRVKIKHIADGSIGYGFCCNEHKRRLEENRVVEVLEVRSAHE